MKLDYLNEVEEKEDKSIKEALSGLSKGEFSMFFQFFSDNLVFLLF